MSLASILTFAVNMILILDLIASFVVIFYGRKNPAATWAWLMVILVIPYVGVILFFMFGMDSRKYRLFLKKSRDDYLINTNYLDSGIESALFTAGQFKNFSKENIPYIKQYEHLSDMVYLNMFPGSAAFYPNNEVKLYYEGVSKFAALLKDIAEAKSFIHIQYYIVQNDSLGKEIITALAKKAAEGITVRFLVDGMGSYRTPKKFYEPLIKAGGQVAVFQPPYFIRINYRNHRKICCVDGNIGYIGGLNIGEEYISKKKRFGFWRDTHIRISGGAVNQLQLRFIMDWNFCSKDKISMEEKYFNGQKHTGDTGIQIVSSGPDTKWPVIQYAYNKMITEAEKYVYIQTPYFVPDDSVFESLRIAALSGIDVRIMIPANPDHPFVYWAGLSYLGELLADGVKCYEYTKGFVHSKVVVVDGCVSSVGTANMDVRSFKLNLETNAFMYDEKVALDIERRFLLDINDCRQITAEYYNKRSVLTKIKEAFSRLLSPLL